MKNKPLVSIGILAHNEQDNIANVLYSLFAQSIFDIAQVELVVYCNGCDDETFNIASEMVTEFSDKNGLCSGVIDDPDPGKAMAWNAFVHYWSDKNANFLVLMDADIDFEHVRALEGMLYSLMYSDDKTINVGHPQKSIMTQKHKTMLETLSCMASRKPSGPPQLCGQLYMAKAQRLRQVALPIGINGDDGFIAEMIATDFFRLPYDTNREMIAQSFPTHNFEAYTKPGALIRHEKEQVKSIVCQEWLYKYLRTFKDDRAIQFVHLISARNTFQPEWVKEICFREAAKTKFHLEFSWFFRRFASISLIRIPTVLISTLVDWIVFFQANRDLNNGKFETYWR